MNSRFEIGNLKWLCKAIAAGLLLWMAPAGQAQRFLRTVDSIAQLKAINTSAVDVRTNGIVHVLGYAAAGDGGDGIFVWNSTDVSSTNLGTIFKGVTTGGELATGRWNRVRNQTGPVRLGWFGASNSGDDAKVAAALALGNHLVIDASAGLASDLSIGRTVLLEFAGGAMLKPATNTTITILGGIRADQTAQIFDFTAGGNVSFPVGSRERVPNIWARWFGASPDGVNGDDSSLAFDKLTAAIASDGGPEVWFSPGNYNYTNTLAIKSGMRWFAKGNPVQLTWKRAAHNGIAAQWAANSQNVFLSGFTFRNGWYSTGIGSTQYTNEIALQMLGDASRGYVEECTFTGWSGRALDFNGAGTGQQLYPTFVRPRFNNCDNAVANGGNGLKPAVLIYATNTFSEVSIYNLKATSYDQAFDLDCPASPASSRFSNLKLFGGSFEPTGTGVTPDYGMRFANGIDVNFYGVRIEGAKALRSAIFCDGVDAFNYFGGMVGVDYGGTIYATNSVWLTNCVVANIEGVDFNNIGTGGFWIWSTNALGEVNARGCKFDFGTSHTQATEAQILARVSLDVKFNGHFRLGSAANPAIGFSDESGLGWDRRASGNMSLAIGGSYVFEFDANSFHPRAGDTGTLGTPGLTFDDGYGEGTFYWRGMASGVTTKTANYTTTRKDQTILVDASGGAVTITLLAPASAFTSPQGWGKIFEVVKVDSSANAVTVQSASGTISGGTVTLASQYDSMAAKADGTNYMRLWTIPDSTVTSAKILDGTIANADISASAAIALTKMASVADGTVLGNSSGSSAAASAISTLPSAVQANITQLGTQAIAVFGMQGSASAPSFTFSGRTNDGIYSSAANVIGFTVNGSQRFKMDTAALSPAGGNTYDLGTSGLTYRKAYVETFLWTGGIQEAIVTKTANYTTTTANTTILVDCTSGAVTITLLAPASAYTNPSGAVYRVKKIDSSGNAVTVSVSGGSNIDGSASVTISSQYAGKVFQSNGTQYYVVGSF